MKEKLLDMIAKKELKVGVSGLGYVGLPLAVEKARSGYDTIGFEVDENKAKAINNKENYIQDVDDDELRELVESGKLKATTDYSKVADLDFIAIAVPTPLDIYQQPDTSYIEKSARSIGKYLKKGSIVEIGRAHV